MKNLLLSLSVFFISTIATFAQLEKGHIKYSIEMTTDNPEMEMAVAMMQGSTMETYFTKNASRIVTNMGSFMTQTIISDLKEKKALMLMSGMMGKQAIRIDNLEETEEDTEAEEVDVQLIDESKEIAGYDCKKAIITDEDGMEMTYWYTEDIAFQKNPKKNMELPGLALEFQTFQNDMTMTMTATEVNKKFKETDDMFSLEIPEGYQETTLEELQNSMGGGQ